MAVARGSLACLLILAFMLAGACRQQSSTDAGIQLEMSASELRVGGTTLTLNVADAAGNAIESPGTLSLRGDMDHAGMAPVLVEVDKALNGSFSAPFEWTMAGDWIVEASLRFENGLTARDTFKFKILPASADADMAGMDHENDMSHQVMNGGSSAVYMQITNRGDSDIAIRRAGSAAAEVVEMHRTIIEDDVARMEAMDELIIPAGATVELQPGGAHIMLRQLSADLLPDNQFMLQLSADSGEVYDLEVSVLAMPPDELNDAVEIGALLFSNRWARPASALADAAMGAGASDG